MILTEINFKDNDFDDNNILKTSSNILHTVIKEGSVNPVEQETETLKINDVLIINDQYFQ